MIPLDGLIGNQLDAKDDIGYGVNPPSSPEPSFWDRISSGWNNFWSEIGDRLGAYGQQSEVGQAALVSLADPSAAEGVGNAAVSGQVLPPGSSEVPNINDVGGSTGSSSSLDNEIEEALQGSPSVSDYISSHPGASAEDVLGFMAHNSDEWAEKWMDYVLERDSIDRANQYTANREDTAYQRLVTDLKKAGLNPAMMYGSSAGTSASGSAGTIGMSSGATSKTISNYNKLKTLMLSYMLYNLKLSGNITNLIGNGLTSIFSLLG